MPEPPQAARQRRLGAARPVKIDTTKAHSARMYDYYLGGWSDPASSWSRSGARKAPGRAPQRRK
jgi:hypothetical protein